MTINFNIPKNWNELTDRQLKKLASIFHSKNNKLQDVLIFLTLLNQRWWQLRKSYKASIILKNVGISELKTHYSFLYEKHNNYL